jgi:predicted HTH transcriptional regulator
MTADRTPEYLAGLVRELCKLPHETEWLEFKGSNADPREIGEYISALANAAAIDGKAFAYLVWGIEDETHRVIGTSFSPSAAKKGNEALASLMRRFRICEERGSGIDKVVSEVEFYQLPAPLFETPDGFTRSVLFAHKPLGDMSKADRVRACYLHACLRYVTRQPMTNSSVRERFGIAEKNASAASRLLNEAVAASLIVLEDTAVGTRARTYLPYWAAPRVRREEFV